MEEELINIVQQWRKQKMGNRIDSTQIKETRTFSAHLFMRDKLFTLDIVTTLLKISVFLRKKSV